MHLAAPSQHHLLQSTGNQRLVHLDALRGFALFGILAVNIWAFADPYYSTAAINPLYDSTPGRIARSILDIVFEMKFYLLFSFLFGVSFTLQMTSAQQAGVSFMARMLRRQAGLLTIGFLHYVLLYDGDILITYAILGLILLACRNIKPSTAVAVGTTLLVLHALLWIALGLSGLSSSTPPAKAGGLVDAQAQLTALSGGIVDTARYHLSNMSETVKLILELQGPGALAMFFFGYAAGRRELFAHQHQWCLSRHIVVLAFLIGFAGSVAYALGDVLAIGSAWDTLGFGVAQLTAPLLSMCYALAVLALLRSEKCKGLRTALATVGKISLTNYLLQSVALCLIFTGYGFGLINRVHPFVVLLLVPMIFLVQIGLSRWWLRTHPYGPAEWLLRAVTIAKLPAWRRD